MNKIKNNNFIKSLLINTGIMILIMMNTRMVYETNDDFAVASRIVEGYPEIFFINYFYASLLVKIQAVIPNLNAFVVLQILACYISLTCILKVLFDHSKLLIVKLCSIAAVVIYSFDAYCTIQFSKTAALTCLAGGVLLIEGITKEKKLNAYILGTVLLFWGSANRIDVLIVVIAYSFIFLFKLFIENAKTFNNKLKVRDLFYILLTILIVVGCYGAKNASNHMLERTPELKNYSEYSYLRGEVVDTPRLKSYHDNMEEYEKVGLSENDLSLIKGWVLDYDGAASIQNLQRIISISDVAENKKTFKKATKQFIKGTVQGLENYSSVGIHIALMLIIALWIIITGKNSSRMFVVIIGTLTVALHVYIYYLSRPANRTLFAPDICATVLMLLTLTEFEKPKICNIIIGVISLIMITASIIPIYHNVGKTYQRVSGWIMPEEVLDYIGSNKDSFYVIATREKKSNPSSLFPWKAPNTESEKNLMGTGSWGTLSPYVLDKLENYDMKNPIRDVIDNEKAFYIGNNKDSMTEYYNKWYGDNNTKIELVLVDQIEDFKVWEVTTMKN